MVRVSSYSLQGNPLSIGSGMSSQESSPSSIQLNCAARATQGEFAVGPRDGDVMITHESSLAGLYTIRQLPANGQLSALSRDDAVLLARRFAEAQIVNIWYRDENTLRLLEQYRSTGPAANDTGALS